MPLYLRTLGGLWLEGSEFRRPKPLLLLAYLALEGTKPRRYLADIFFMEASDRMNSLSRALSYLRQEVPGVIDADNKKVWSTINCDASELLSLTDSKQFEKCLELYKGAFAADYELGLSEELEEWLYGTREILAAKARNAFLSLGENEAGKGNFTQAALLAEKAYKFREVVELEPDDFGRLYNLLYAGNSPLATEVRKEAEGFEIPLELSREEAKAQLSEASEVTIDIPNNLPPPKTSFVGRDQELIEIAMQLAKKDCRLLTLHGMGGIGKSRLAIQAANEQLRVTNPSFKDGVYFVTLDALTSAELIPSSIAEALNLELQGQEDTLSQVKRFIGKKHILLLLDNYEHLMAGATLTSKLLEACPNLKLLVTSRERLNVEEEWVLTLDGLTVPTSIELNEVERFDALHLFVQRAKRAMLEFSLTQETLPHALKICQLVEGSPLGIELAAVWVKTLPVSEIAKEIETNLSILEAPTKNVAERHQSIRAAFEHSWKLLTEKEKEVLRKLSVFVGGFRREAAAEVAGATLPILASLVDKSLLRVSENGRYDRHVMIYDFTKEKLEQASEEKSSCQRKFINYYCALTREAEPYLKGGKEQIPWLIRLSDEHANLCSVLDRTLSQGDIDHGLPLVNSLARYFFMRGHFREAVFYCQQFLVLPVGDTMVEHHARLQAYAGVLAWRQGDYVSGQFLLTKSLDVFRKAVNLQGVSDVLYQLGMIAKEQGHYKLAYSLHEESLELRKQLGNEVDVAESLNSFGNIIYFLGDYARAQTIHQESLELRRKSGDKIGLAMSLNDLGVMARGQGDYSLALSLHEESLKLFGLLGHRAWIIMSLLNLGHTHLLQNKFEKAMSYYHSSLKIANEIGHTRYIAENLLGIAGILSHKGVTQASLAMYLVIQSRNLMDKIGAAFELAEQTLFDQSLVKFRAKMGEQQFQLAWQERRVNLDDAVMKALSVGIDESAMEVTNG